jgi:predicted GTPase
MAKLIGAQRLVLQAIQDSPRNAAGSVTDTQVAQGSGITLKDVQDWFETLEGEDLIQVARTTAGLSASITAKGRLSLGQALPLIPAIKPYVIAGPLRLAVLGLTGSGKSALINQLIGRDILGVLSVNPGARQIQQCEAEVGGRRAEIIECPGLGTGNKFDARYFEKYKELVLYSNCIIWTVRADYRAIGLDLQYFEDIHMMAIMSNIKLLLVLTHCDLVHPGDWDENGNCPSADQSRSIELRTMYFSAAFQVPVGGIAHVSSTRGHNIVRLRSLL